MASQPAIDSTDSSRRVLDTREYLGVVYGEDAPGYFVITTKEKLRGKPGIYHKAHWIPAHDLDRAARRICELSCDRDVYLGVALQDRQAALAEKRRRLDAKGRAGEPARESSCRGFASTAIAIPGFWADIDILGPAHKAPTLPPTREAARELVATVPQPASLIVDSGHGIYAWWLFHELWVFADDNEREKAAATSRGFQAYLQTEAARRGWTIDSTADLARVLRPVGSFNYKTVKVS
jgi:hypothetical protein